MTGEPDMSDELAVFAALERALPRVAPRAELFDRILAEVRDEAVVVPLRPSAARQRRTVRLGGLVAIGAAAAVAIGVVVRDDEGGLGDPTARAAIASKTDPSVAGEALLYDDRVVVSLANVPVAPAGHHYEVWVLPEGSDEMVSLGTFDPDEATDVQLELELPAQGSYAAVDVSVEEDDGPPEHGPTSLGTGYFA